MIRETLIKSKEEYRKLLMGADTILTDNEDQIKGLHLYDKVLVKESINGNLTGRELTLKIESRKETSTDVIYVVRVIDAK